MMRRAVDCSCGHHLEADDNDELFVALRAHADVSHPEMTDDEIRAIIKSSARDAG
ncbi:MAG: DUF1059 domain-containing protein [Actinobacteria bacterium]|nr:DUF1059 domain-containing protein [Actinomycetota bacterium]